MPTYGYRCSKCANEFDVVERMADKPRGRCPLCGGRGTRLFFPVGIVFKGTGFYKTDSRGENRGPASDRPPAAGSETAQPTPAAAPAEGDAAASTREPVAGSDTPAVPAATPSSPERSRSEPGKSEAGAAQGRRSRKGH